MATYVEPQIAVTPSYTRAGLLRERWPLLVVLTLQAVISITALHNTAFQDEALYLYAGRQIIHHWNGGPVPLDNYASYFSGYPYIYPVIGGFLDMIGGLDVARDFSIACMLGVTWITHSVTRKLFDQPAAIFASAIYASTGVVLFLGRLATYDALCLFLIALATAFSVHCGMGKRPWAAFAIGPVLVLAMLAKYAALLFILPVFCLLICLSFAFLGWRAALLRLAAALASFTFSLGVALKTINREALHGLTQTTTNRAVSFKEPRLGLFTHVLHMGGLVYLIAFFGLTLIMQLQWRFRALAVLLFGSSWLVPAYHIYVQEPISLDKHIAYGLFFVVPLAGYALSWLSGYERRPPLSSYRGYWLAGLAVVLGLSALGLGQARTLYAGWADTSGLSYGLHTQLRDGSGRILAEDIEVARYDTLDVAEPWQWNSFYYPYYIDHAGQHLFGNPALAQAVRDRYYDWVELSFNYLPGGAYFLAGQMASTKNYDLIMAIPFENSYGKGHFYLWRRALMPGQGSFKSMAQLKMNVWP